MNEHDQISRDLNAAFGRNVCCTGPTPLKRKRRSPKPPKAPSFPILPVVQRAPHQLIPRCTKTRYPDKKTAATVANHRTTGRKRIRRNRPEFLRAYHCPACNGWHITSTE